ncbi:MAG: hypothetical protein AAF721_10325 [Myxococcota bacterium]
MDAVTCGLCAEQLAASRFVRDFGMELCEVCRSGHAPERMRPTGMVVLGAVHRRQLQTTSGALHYAHVTATGRWAYPFHAEISREKLKHLVISLFKEELEVGDALFDDEVWIDTADPTGTAKLLRKEGAQSAVLRLVGFPAGKVEIAPGELRTIQKLDEPDQGYDAQILATCALARHLQPLDVR